MTKNDLQKGYFIKIEIASIQEMIEELKANLYSLQGVQNKERVQGGDISPDKVILGKLGKLTELEKRLQELIDFQFCLVEEIEKMPNVIYKAVLKYRYVNNYTWRKIADLMYCDEKTARRRHKKALEEFLKISDDALECPHVSMI